MTSQVDFGFMVWGSAYVVLKWTVGLWTIRRVKYRLDQSSRAGVEAVTIPRQRSQNRKV